MIDHQPLQLLDVVEIPLAAHDRGYEVENRRILCPHWKRVRRVTPFDITQYVETELLHQLQEDWLSAVPFHYLKTLPVEQRRTIQIVKANDFQVFSCKPGKWKGSFSINGACLTASITDPALLEKLNAGYQPSCFCLLVMSFSQPWKKPDTDDIQRCYRLIAGVIEL
ncbi:MAG: hypothetical protein D6742_06750 [Cyanobacteria bacterium J069]|nr:MAG: hypothetical protein D6742_06750 [Cyanobacteria bacterium J069]